MTETCLNCGAELDSDDYGCPYCDGELCGYCCWEKDNSAFGAEEEALAGVAP